MLLAAGARVDRYEVLDLLGSGGMGEVYRARDPKLARLVALKVLRADDAAGTGGTERLLREARAVAALSHPNVLAVYDVGEVQAPEALQGLSYIAMELVKGRSLRAYVGDATVPMARRVAWLRDVASALAAAHEAGIVHRDVKPENVMIRDDGVAKVLDFGIARRTVTEGWSWDDVRAMQTGDTVPVSHLPTITAQGVIVGTPAYMAPEQLRGEALDARVDQFAWGVVAYALVTGTEPWGTPDAVALVSRILSYEPPAPAQVDASVPRDLSNAIVRALAKRPEDRFDSMAAIAASLDGAPTEAIEAPVFATRSTGPKRLLVSALICAGLVAAITTLVRWRGRPLRAGTPTEASKVAVASGVAEPACTTNAQCVHAHGGEAWHCHSKRHVCLPIASEDCKAYAEPNDAEAEDVVWIGGMFPADGNGGESNALDLARQDFARTLGPSVARGGALHARPIAIAMCSETANESRAARHLAEDVEVPAVVGFRSMSGALQVIPTELLPNHVLSIVSISQVPQVTRIPEPPGEPRLVWRTTLDYESVALPLARFVSESLEPLARSNGLGTRPFRVAAVLSKAINHDFVDAFFRALRFNGKSALENGSDFRQFALDNDDGAAPHEDVVRALLDFAPAVVYYAGSGFFPKGFASLEARWRQRLRPTYVTVSGLDPALLPLVGRDASRRHRFFAVTNLATTVTNAELVLRYNMAHPEEPVERSSAPQPSYDAFYVLAYATHAVGRGPITGPALSAAIDRLLPPGRPIDVGPASIYEGFGALRAGEGIDLRGAIGSLDFDRATGEAPIDYAITCFGADRDGVATAQSDSGLVYDARTDQLVGKLRCP